MTTSTTLLSSAVASALAPNSNLSDTNNNNEHDTYSYNIESLRKIEERYQCADYIKVKESKGKHIIDGNCRARVCRWMFDVVDSLNMSRDTAVAAMCNLDRLMSATKKATFDRKEYQLGKYMTYSNPLAPRGTSRCIKLFILCTCILTHSTFIFPFYYSSYHTIRLIILASITALAIAIKVSETREVDASVLSRLSRGLQSSKDIERYEREMIVALKYMVDPPTPFQFINSILDHLPGSLYAYVTVNMYNASHRKAEELIQHHESVSRRRSSIAIAAILSTLSKMSQDELPMEQRTQFIKNLKDVYQYLSTSNTVSDTE